jgi:L-arabinose isomerase
VGGYAPTAAESWLSARAPHHSAFSQPLTTEAFVDFAEITGCELIVIDDRSTVRDIKNELRWNELAHRPDWKA